MECWLEMDFLGMVVRRGDWREELCEYHFVDEYVNLEALEHEVPLQDFGMEGMKQCKTRNRVLDSSLERAKWSLERASPLLGSAWVDHRVARANGASALGIIFYQIWVCHPVLEAHNTSQLTPGIIMMYTLIYHGKTLRGLERVTIDHLA